MGFSCANGPPFLKLKLIQKPTVNQNKMTETMMMAKKLHFGDGAFISLMYVSLIVKKEALESGRHAYEGV